MNAGAAPKRGLRSSGCTTYSSDIGVHLPTSGRYAYPDVTVVCGEPEFAEASDALGRRVAVLHDGPATGETVTFDTAGLPAGVYAVRARTTAGVATRRVVVRR